MLLLLLIGPGFSLVVEQCGIVRDSQHKVVKSREREKSLLVFKVSAAADKSARVNCQLTRLYDLKANGE